MNNLPWYFWVIAVALLASAWWFHRRAENGIGPRRGGSEEKAAGETAASKEGADGPVGAELVAVIAAAVAAASGMSPSQFRIAGISRAGAAGPAGAAGEGSWSTPLWGRVERFARPDNHR